MHVSISIMNVTRQPPTEPCTTASCLGIITRNLYPQQCECGYAFLTSRDPRGLPSG